MMGPVLAIAWNTCLEALREKVLYLLAGFAVVVSIGSRLLAPLALGEGRRVTVDLGLGGLSLFGMLLVVFVGRSLVHREIERGSVSFLFSRPLGRGAFLSGKFLGLALVLALGVVSMGGVLALVLAASGHPLGAGFLAALAVALLELWILAAVAILLSAVASPVLSGLLVLAGWTIGNTAGDLLDLAALLPDVGAQHAVRALLWLLPRLDLYDPAACMLRGGPSGADAWLTLVAYAALYAVAALAFARAAFERRSLLG